MFCPSRARLASWRPLTQRCRILENSAVPALLARTTHVLPSCYYARAEGDLEACWNRILTGFDAYTFLHSQGHGRTKRRPGRHGHFASGQPPGADLLRRSGQLSAVCQLPTHAPQQAPWTGCSQDTTVDGNIFHPRLNNHSQVSRIKFNIDAYHSAADQYRTKGHQCLVDDQRHLTNAKR